MWACVWASHIEPPTGHKDSSFVCVHSVVSWGSAVLLLWMLRSGQRGVADLWGKSWERKTERGWSSSRQRENGSQSKCHDICLAHTHNSPFKALQRNIFQILVIANKILLYVWKYRSCLWSRPCHMAWKGQSNRVTPPQVADWSSIQLPVPELHVPGMMQTLLGVKSDIVRCVEALCHFFCYNLSLSSLKRVNIVYRWTRYSFHHQQQPLGHALLSTLSVSSSLVSWDIPDKMLMDALFTWIMGNNLSWCDV